jgi:hypothetical protein
VTDLSGLLKHPATALTVGAAATALGLAVETYRACERLPIVGARLCGVRSALQHRGEEVLSSGLQPAATTITAVAVQIVDRVLDGLDLNELVRERIDLIGLADEVVAGIDLPGIIRDSTSSVTAEVMDDVRSQGERADDAVSGLVDRILRRDRDLR